MDLFEAIVRLEAKGLTAGPPAEVPAGAPLRFSVLVLALLAKSRMLSFSSVIMYQ